MNANRACATLAALSLSLVVALPVAAEEDDKRVVAAAAAWKQLEATPECCSEFGLADFTDEVTMHFKSRQLRTDRARNFDGFKAYFHGWRLPAREDSFFMQIGSGSSNVANTIRGASSAYFFDPSVLFLDADLRVVRRIDHFACKPSGFRTGEMGYFGIIKVDPQTERFAVLFANPESKNKGIEFQTPAPFIPTVKRDWSVPFGPNGAAEARIASDATQSRLRSNRNPNCKIVE